MMKTTHFNRITEPGLNPYRGFTGFQHFNGEPLYSDVIVRPENRMNETDSGLQPLRWLPGETEDAFTVALPENLPAGRRFCFYRKASCFVDKIKRKRYTDT